MQRSQPLTPESATPRAEDPLTGAFHLLAGIEPDATAAE